jgi:uncharacterized protein YecT (DUF1311 family)
MRRYRPFAALSLSFALALRPACMGSPAHASGDNSDLAFSSAAALVDLCGPNSVLTPDACKQGGTDKLVADLDRALQAALAKAPANIKPLLKRDQAWFGEMIASAAEQMPDSEKPADRNAFTKMLRDRIAALGQIQSGFGRGGVIGTWQDTFGSVTVTAAGDGAYRVAIATDAIYGTDEGRRWTCRATALVKQVSDGWLSGEITPEIPPEQAAAGKDYKSPDAKPGPLVAIKLRRQGETLRIVVDENDTRTDTRPHCANVQPVTASYFASGATDAPAAADKADTSFATPTFDCTKPYSATDEEICADPELADNDQRLNRDWKALLPRLDDATRHALSEDQRLWVKSQTHEYPDQLHPAMAKSTSFMHYAGQARDALFRLQRGRMALLEGFDETRKGFGGVWLSYTAMVKVTQDEKGSVSAEGFKWFQGDWKGGCEYAIAGQIKGGMFRADDKGQNDKGKNPDTLERDHAMLIVNRLDEAFAAKRQPSDDEDNQKCKRSPSVSSTARLFPARPSPDFDNYP